jgi:protein-S-isoprenylcysteine O-methyltransferase Ste14
LVAISWILPVWAIVLFRREGTEVEPTSPTNRKLVTSGPYQFTRNPMYLGLVILTLGIAICRRLANVWGARSDIRYCQLGPHSL